MSFYGTFSNKNADGSPVTFTQALSDVFLHPIDSLRGFVAAPVALLAGTAASTAQTVSGMALTQTSDLPSVQNTLADVVRGTVQAPNLDNASDSTGLTVPGLPLWVKVTAGFAAVVAVAVLMHEEFK